MTGYKWYIVQAHSGFEKKVVSAITEKAEREKLSDNFEEIVVPTEKIVEIKKGKKVNSDRKFFPGYVLVKMKMNDKSLHLVRSISKVSGFLGGKKEGNPLPIPQPEVDRILQQVKDGLEKPQHTVSFEIGESVRINDGPFESFVGIVEEVDDDKGRLKVSVSIFGRSTPVELEFVQVEKV